MGLEGTMCKEDKNGIIWMGTYGAGVSKIDADAFKFSHYHRNPLKENSLSMNDVWAIEIDESGDWWIGTWGGGLNRLKVENEIEPKFDVYTTTNSRLANDKITTLLNDRQDNLWVGTWGNGVQKVLLDANKNLMGFENYPIKVKGEVLLNYNNIKTIFF